MENTAYEVPLDNSVETHSSGNRSRLNEIAHLGEASEEEVMPVEASIAGNDDEESAETIHVTHTVTAGSKVIDK